MQCQNCQTINQPGMAFCTNCGTKMPAPKPSEIPTAPKVMIAPTLPQAAAPVSSGNKSSKLWIGGLLGCFGLVAVGIVGLVALSLFSRSISDTPLNSNKKEAVSNADKNSKSGDSNTGENRTIGDDPSEDSVNTELLDILKDRKEAGRFKQTTSETVKVNDYFPRAIGAAQAIYHNGSR